MHDENFTISFGEAKVRRPGRDVTVVATSYMVSLAVQAADSMKQQGVSLEVIDPRTLEPLGHRFDRRLGS